MGVLFKQSAAFGKRRKYNLIGEMSVDGRL